MSVSPLIRTPITDLSNALVHYETMKQCRPFYLQYAKCQEAWGSQQAPGHCKLEYTDLMECCYHTREHQRVVEIKKQREKLYKEGKLKQRYMDAPPPNLVSQSHLHDPY